MKGILKKWQLHDSIYLSRWKGKQRKGVKSSYHSGDLVLDVLLQATKTILGGLQDVIVLADSETKVILSDMFVSVSVELSGRDRSNSDFVNQEPAELKITRTAGNVGRELVVVRELHRGHVGENKVATLGVGVLSTLDTVHTYGDQKEWTYRNTKLLENLAEAVHLALHLCAALVPESNLVGLLEGNGGSFLEGRHAAVTDAGVGGSDVLDQVLGADQEANTPAGCIERLSSGTNGQGTLVQLGRQGGDAGEWGVVETVVHLVRQDDEVVLDAEIADTFQFSTGKDLSNGVVTDKLAYDTG